MVSESFKAYFSECLLGTTHNMLSHCIQVGANLTKLILKYYERYNELS